VIGRLIEEDEGVRTDVTSEVLAFDSHDVTDLTAEEAAIHLIVEEEEGEDLRDPSLTRSARKALKEF
jgi:hypothetical protein